MYQEHLVALFFFYTRKVTQAGVRLDIMFPYEAGSVRQYRILYRRTAGMPSPSTPLWFITFHACINMVEVIAASY